MRGARRRGHRQHDRSADKPDDRQTRHQCSDEGWTLLDLVLDVGRRLLGLLDVAQPAGGGKGRGFGRRSRAPESASRAISTASDIAKHPGRASRASRDAGETGKGRSRTYMLRQRTSSRPSCQPMASSTGRKAKRKSVGGRTSRMGRAGSSRRRARWSWARQPRRGRTWSGLGGGDEGG